MKIRNVVIVLSAALAVSVGVNLFAATAAYTALSGQDRERVAGTGPESQRHPSSREMIGALSPAERDRVRQALRAAAQRARPDFQASREARSQAVAAASAQPLDTARVKALLEQARVAEARGRQMLETDAVAILQTLTPADRVVFARILRGRARSSEAGRGDRQPEPASARSDAN